MRFLVVSSHAIARYQQRVRPAATRLEALAEIREIASRARVRSRPRWWTRVAGERPGCRYLYCASRPDVCLVVRNGVVVTVFTRQVCALWRAALAPADSTRWLTPVPATGKVPAAALLWDREAA
ncbi:MAG: hypothetical protein ACRDPY_15815 [Streptosporangiaceae bacterium]